MTQKNPKPFSQAFVLKTTVKHMRKDVDISIRKTLERIGEFSGDSVRSKEIFETLSILHAMKKNLDDFEKSQIPSAIEGS